MPHIINVTGFNFIPIHNFIPQIQKNDYNATFTGGTFGTGTGNVLSAHGAQRYLALTNGFSTNYKGPGANGNVVVDTTQEQLEEETNE